MENADYIKEDYVCDNTDTEIEVWDALSSEPENFPDDGESTIKFGSNRSPSSEHSQADSSNGNSSVINGANVNVIKAPQLTADEEVAYFMSKAPTDQSSEDTDPSSIPSPSPSENEVARLLCSFSESQTNSTSTQHQLQGQGASIDVRVNSTFTETSNQGEHQCSEACDDSVSVESSNCRSYGTNASRSTKLNVAKRKPRLNRQISKQKHLRPYYKIGSRAERDVGDVCKVKVY